MKSSNNKSTTDRRGFLKLVGSGTVGGAAAAITAGTAAAPGAEAAGKSQDGLYQETPHVKTYYDLAKF